MLSGRTFAIGPKGLLIGRDPSNCQIVVADDEVSRLHAWVGFDQEARLILRDRDSANGTYVNRVRVQETALRATDEVSLGTGLRQVFRVQQIASTGPGTKTPSAGRNKARG